VKTITISYTQADIEALGLKNGDEYLEWVLDLIVEAANAMHEDEAEDLQVYEEIEASDFDYSED
jgi:hypothetical protein